MSRCPITYKKLRSSLYSNAGLRLISNKISGLEPVDIEFSSHTPNPSSPELKSCFARLIVKKNCFVIGSESDRYIFIDDAHSERQYNFNRDLTLKLAQLSGIKTVVHGLAHAKNGGMFLWYKHPRFYGRYTLLPLIPFSELFQKSDLPLAEKLRSVLNARCTFPALERLKLLRLLLFGFLTGSTSINPEDLALTKKKETTEIAPVDNLLNRAIYLEIYDKNLITFLGQELCIASMNDAYTFATETLGVNPKAFNQVLKEFDSIYLKWLKLIEISFLNARTKKSYLELLRERRKVFFKF